MRPARRYVVHGAGGIGCAIGGSLLRAGEEVVLVARGAQLEALRLRGLLLRTPSRAEVLRVDVVGAPAEIAWRDDDVILLCVKSQDTPASLATLAAAAPRAAPIVCAQNGVVNERLAAAAFERVYGMVVFAPVSFLVPGEVDVHSEPVLGGLDVGCWPAGSDDVARRLAADLTRAGFDAHAEAQVARLKYGKLLGNLGNAVQALCASATTERAWVAACRAEASACYRAAAIDSASLDEIRERYSNVVDLPIAGAARRGGSTWQSLARGTGSIEVDALNGEIVRLGLRCGVPTPVNVALVELGRRAAVERWPPGHLSAEELDRAMAALLANPRAS
jgi:2-dehydropantoate 2-reductase